MTPLDFIIKACPPVLKVGSGAVCQSGTGVPPVNHAQDALATFKLHH